MKAYEERMEKIESLEVEYQNMKEKSNTNEKPDFYQAKVETSYKALENELK